MSYGRRTTDRRRRVLYSSHHAENEPSTAASRRAALKLREARRPSAAYGSRVHRRLRGRWFSLVPVRRRALIAWTATVGLVTLLLCFAHYASVTWPSIAYRPEIARALRLDRPDSFGRWFTCVLLAGCAGISLLIYQLRRHKNDDYRGHYRLWRLMLVILLLASIDALASLVDWGGALVDAGFGKRVALSGNDWIRIGLSIGGAVLALRLTVEVRRSRWALLTMVIACVVLAFPVAARWNLFEVDTIGRWTLVTSAPLMVSALLFVSLGGYLRMLFREVRNIEDSRSVSDRLGELRLRLFAGSDESELPPALKGSTAAPRENRKEDQVNDRESPPKSGWFGRGGRDDAESAGRSEKTVARETVSEESEAPPKKKRGWFASRKTSSKDASLNDDAAEKSDSKPTKRSRFSLRLRPTAETSETTKQADQNAQASQTSDDRETGEAKPKKRFGLGGWMKGKKPVDTGSEDTADEPANASEASSRQQQSYSASQEDEEIDVDSIDWDSMSKSERRRLRKKLKRQGRAA